MLWPASASTSYSRRQILSRLSRRLILLLLLIGGIHPHPGPPTSARQTPASSPPISLLSWNCNGLRSSVAELVDFLDKRQVKVACLQETKLTAAARTPSFRNYAVLRRDRPNGGGGGLITLIHQSISFSHLQSPFNDDVTEAIVIKVNLNDEYVNIANIYIPPQSSCPASFRASLRSRRSRSSSRRRFSGRWGCKRPQRTMVGRQRRYPRRFDCR